MCTSVKFLRTDVCMDQSLYNIARLYLTLQHDKDVNSEFLLDRRAADFQARLAHWFGLD